MELGVGMGYAEHEFRAFGIPRSRRVSLMEEGIEVLRRAWSGERFSFEGKRWRFEDVLVTPRPGPAGRAAAVDRRHERGVGRAGGPLRHPPPAPGRPLGGARPLAGAAGGATAATPADFRVGLIRSCFVTDDPERDWAPIKAAERYRMSVYARFFAETPDRLSAFDREPAVDPAGLDRGRRRPTASGS